MVCFVQVLVHVGVSVMHKLKVGMRTSALIAHNYTHTHTHTHILLSLSHTHTHTYTHRHTHTHTHFIYLKKYKNVNTYVCGQTLDGRCDALGSIINALRSSTDLWLISCHTHCCASAHLRNRVIKSRMKSVQRIRP